MLSKLAKQHEGMSVQRQPWQGSDTNPAENCIVTLVAEDALKLQFCLDALESPSPFGTGEDVPSSVRDAIR